MTDDRSASGPPRADLVTVLRASVARDRLLQLGDHVLVGVSGGPDSVALLHALTLLRHEYDLRLTVCHVHHGLRPEADRDAHYVEALAGRLSCLAHVIRVEVSRGGGRSPEEAARVARYAALRRAARMAGADRIALGHTADDQVETVLMRVLQGAGPRGLAGMPRRRGRIIRPLLDVTRGAVWAHLAAHGLETVDDATNRDSAFLRNRVRHEILPLLVARGGSRVPAALIRLARASRETVEALDALVRPRLAAHLTRMPVGWRLGLAAFEGLLPGAVKVALRMAVVEVAAPDRLGTGLRAGHLDALAGLLTAATGARVRLPAGVVVERGRDALWLLPPRTSGPMPLAVPGRASAGHMVDVIASIGEPESGRPADPAWEAWFDAWALGVGPEADAPSPAALLVRAGRPGERMVPFGGCEPVRLTKLLAGAGVPRHARAGWPVVARDGQPGEDDVLWLMGVRRGAAAPLSGATRLMLRLRAQVRQPAGTARPEGASGLPDGDAV
jgi:tRNA(Ile)-lysidine synthase